jgi:N-acetylglucosaminyldiphosphoundecaprenol N-acetyl-beta-D-mannosaminyltransferase
MKNCQRFRVLDCLISRTDLQHATQTVIDQITSGDGGYVCFSNVHTVVTALSDERLREITNASLLSVPDGRPLSVIAQHRGLKDVHQVAGPDFLPHFLAVAGSVRHFFYGSTPETIERLTVNLRRRFPNAIIAGSYSPPFRPLSAHEVQEVRALIRHAHPDVIWVGLGAPKQEYWMAENWRELRPAILMGVGAAFDFHAGTVTRAPQWMRQLSMEWVFRLFQEPRRLLKRYLVTNSLFLYHLMKAAVVGRLGKRSRA